MPASVLIDRPTPEATTGSLPSAGLGPPGEVAPPSAVHQEEPRAGDSFALQLANFARSTTNANVSEYSSSQGKQPAFGPMGAGSSPVLGRCGPPVTMQHQGPSSAAQLTNRKSMNMTECVHVASSEHVAEIVGRQGSKIKALRAKTNTYIKTPVRGEEPVFVVTGRKEDVAAAKKEILSIAEHFGQIRAGRLNNNTGNRTSSALGHLNTDIPGHVTIHVRVPYRVVGLVVGPKGATIKRIQQDSQTYIVTPSRDREPIFEVTGLSENVEKARCEIESYIALRTGTGLSETGLNSSNNTATMFRPFSRNSGLLEDLPGKDAQLLLGSVFKPPSCNTMTSSALASFNNTLNLSMAAKNHPLAENGAEQCGGLYQGLLTANKKLDGVLPNFVSTAGLQNEFGVYNSSKAFEKLVSPYCNNNLLANDFWSQVNNLETPLLLDGLTSFFPSAEEIAALQNEQLMSDCNARTLDSLNFTSSLSLFGNCNGDIDKSGKDKNLCGQLMVNSGAPAYIATVHSGSVGSASNSPSVSPTDSVGSPGQRRRRCIICSDGDVVAALVPCGHNLFCMECAQAVLERTDQLERRCPVCQQTASLAVRIIS